MIKAGAALDQTVKLAVDFARRHPGTLIVVQGDHETGGLTIENPDTEDETGDALSREDGPFAVKGTQLSVFRRLDGRTAHRGRHADHRERPRFGGPSMASSTPPTSRTRS
jgi:alkaline phosphatase